MKYPEFFNQVPAIQLQDPLSDFLGAFEGGLLEISYLDCVKLAGHSCPTVAGAYLMALKGLQALYGDDLPQRGSIHVAMRDDETAGVTGVIANVIAFIVGATGAGGFKGIQGKYARNKLLSFNHAMEGEVMLTRTDTNASISMSYNPSIIPPDEKMPPLMGKCLKGLASEEERKTFAKLWQARVEKILMSPEHWDEMLVIH